MRAPKYKHNPCLVSTRRNRNRTPVTCSVEFVVFDSCKHRHFATACSNHVALRRMLCLNMHACIYDICLEQRVERNSKLYKAPSVVCAIDSISIDNKVMNNHAKDFRH